MQIISIICRLACACWFGGAALFTFVLTPVIFASYSRDVAGGIVGVLFPGYFRWGLVCGVVALICLLVSEGRWQRAPVWILFSMLIVTAIQAFVIEPQAARLKGKISSFENTAPDHPLRQEFRRLHGLSAAANLSVIGGGAIVLVLLPGGRKRKNEDLTSRGLLADRGQP